MAMNAGLLGIVLRVNLSTGKIEKELMDEAFARKYVGGRGFTSRLQYDLIPVNVDPLGPENVLIIAPGALTGTSAAAAARFVVGARSPLTGILGDANGGGFFGPVLRRAGYSLLLISGQSDKPVYLWIDNDHVELRDASHLWGKDVHYTTDALQKEYGKGARVAAIGQAGENLVRIAGIIADKDHAAARTGVGAVMGSKKLKAIAVRGTQAVPLYDRKTFQEYAAKMEEIEAKDKRAQDFAKRGTLGTLIDHHTAIGGLNTRNYQFGQFEGKELIDNDALAERYLVKTTGCYRCPLNEDRYSRVTEGEYAGVEVGGPEYSTAAAFGSGVGNDNLAAILKANDICNRYGLDTIDTGGVIAFSMELYQRGILTKEDTDGLELTWGNYHAMIELVERIALRKGAFANLLAYGVHGAAQEIGRGAERYAVHVKGMTPAPLDARAVKVYNFRYAVGPRGADHLRISVPGGYTLDSLPLDQAAQKLQYWQNIVALPDIMGTCKFVFTYYCESVEMTLRKNLEIIPALYNAATGFGVSADDLLNVTTRVTNIERAHNNRLGLNAKDDVLPPRFTQDPMPDGPAKGKVYDILDPMKEAWYKVEEWDPVSGVVTRQRLEDLDLSDIADDLERRGVLLV
jgi:aldehyde:ferredoxin oxidoreductase